ncbi:MAG: hypothetical protein HC913_12875 [Microscillaceae bacterium]|nr:hypothetical protein [Microscillaceae bacterium]
MEIMDIRNGIFNKYHDGELTTEDLINLAFLTYKQVQFGAIGDFSRAVPLLAFEALSNLIIKKF